MELWDLYTKEGIRTGQTMVRGEKQPEGLYHLVVHVCIFNDQGKMLIQQRQTDKEGWPNQWDISVGGSAISQESSQAAAQRETFEELGLHLSFDKLRPSFTINFENGFDDVYLIHQEIEISQLNLQVEEVQQVKWASCDEIIQQIKQGEFIPYHKSFIQMCFDMRKSLGAHQQ